MNLSRLAEAYLEGLGLLKRLNDDAFRQEHAEIVARALAAEAAVNQAFEKLRASGEMAALSRKFRHMRRLKTDKGERMVPWSAFLLDEKRGMIRAMAMEQVSRAKRGKKS